VRLNGEGWATSLSLTTSSRSTSDECAAPEPGPQAAVRIFERTSLKKNIETTLILTNATAGTLSLELTLRDDSGATLSTTPLSLAAHASPVVLVSDLLP
jgi:hypothetical protein